jgi:hypothetical protein
MSSTRVLLAISSPDLVRVVEHLLADLPELEIVDRSTSILSLCRDAARLAPDVIVTSARLLGRAPGIADLRRFAPGSKLVVITHDTEWRPSEPRAGSADASLDEEDLVRGLLPILHTLSAAVSSAAD